MPDPEGSIGAELHLVSCERTVVSAIGWLYHAYSDNEPTTQELTIANLLIGIHSATRAGGRPHCNGRPWRAQIMFNAVCFRRTTYDPFGGQTSGMQARLALATRMVPQVYGARQEWVGVESRSCHNSGKSISAIAMPQLVSCSLTMAMAPLLVIRHLAGSGL